jgi:hypothetical protein
MVMRLSDPLLGYSEDFYPSCERILAAMLFLMHLRPGISQYQIVKSIFVADKTHLNEAGRPVTFDKYVAMRQGPVPSLVYALLMDEPLFRAIYGRETPWSYERQGNKGNRYFALESADLDVLSSTDLDALRQGLKKVQQTTPQQLEALLHDDPAYQEAWSRRGTAKSVPMKAVKLLDNESQETIGNLADISYLQ